MAKPLARFSRRDFLRTAGAGLTLLVSPYSYGKALPTLLGVRVWPAADYTRITLEHDQTLKFTHLLLKDPERLVLEVVGPLSRRAEDAFRAAGVLRFVRLVDWMPQSDVSAWLATGDLQIVLNAATRQRIPAKFYECLMVPRPVLVCGATREMAPLTAGMEGVWLCDREDEAPIAAAIRAALTGRRAAVVRETGALTSERAAARLAELLCAVSPRGAVASPSSEE